MSRAARIAKPLLIVWFLLSALSAGIVLWATQSEGGKRYVSNKIAALVTDNIPGRLEIGEITQITWLALRARDVRFFHPDGRCVLHVENAYVEPGLADALRGRLAFARVAADGGSIFMGGDPDGRLALEATMDSAKETGQPSDPQRGLHYDFRNMHVKNFNLRAPIAGIANLQLSNVSGVVHVWRLDSVGTRVRLKNIQGAVAPEVAGAKLAVKQLEGVITGAEAVVADVKTRLSVDKDDALSLRVRYAPEHKHKVQVNVVDKSGTEATTLTWLLHAVESFSGDINVEG
jgi:hypothetical protein